MTRTNRQDYRDVTIDEARALGCDTCQLKFDGWWSRIEVENGVLNYYSRTARLFHTHDLAKRDPSYTLIGEHMQGTQWSQDPERLGTTYLFDIWSYEGKDLSAMPYRARYSVLKMVHLGLPSTFSLVQNYPIAQAQALWGSFVEQHGFEGLVFRKSCDPVATPLYRYKQTVTAKVKIISLYEGKNKYTNSLGGVNTVTSDGTEVSVGGGFSDEQRRAIWSNPAAYIGRWFNLEARAKFASGSFRHPNFVDWCEGPNQDPGKIGRAHV